MNLTGEPESSRQGPSLGETQGKDFAGRVMVVTGAAGGIGAAAAQRLADRGAALVLLDRSADLLESVENSCREAGSDVLSLGVNQANGALVEEGIAHAVDRFGRIDGLFANAGYGQFAPFLDTTAKNWQRHVDVNLHGTFHVCQAVARQIAAQKSGGAIVLNASSGAQTYADQLFAYCATKAAIQMMGVGMASELGVHRIRVNTILPGVIETPMTSSMLEDPRHKDVMLAETPVGRLGDPQDVAVLVAFLLSDDAGFITGASVPIDGGQTIHAFPRWFRLDYRDAHNANWSVPG